MSTRDVTETGATLEELFFARQTEELQRRYRREWHQMARREALQEASGIRDPALVDRLLALGVSARTVAAMVLYPLVAVAWADDRMDGKEKDAIMRAASEVGVTSGSTSRALLDCWLAEKPAREMLDAWVAFARALQESMSPDEFEGLAASTLNHTRRVAEAAGGILGLMKISEKEEAMLQFLTMAFEGTLPPSKS